MGVWVMSLFLIGALPPDLSVHDVDGRIQHPLRPDETARILFFIAPDCPIANSYAPEIQRICGDAKSRGIGCSLVYVDPQLDVAGALKHRLEFGYAGFPAILDSSNRIAEAAGATVTPEAVVIAHDGRILYRGRIDNRWTGLGQQRRQTTVFDLKNALDQIVARKPVTLPETKPVGCFIPSPGILSK
jgi:hypothetical protein